jgi:hypothetical protein
MHAPSGEKHVEHANLAANTVGPFLAGFVIGSDRQIAALPVADAFG